MATGTIETLMTAPLKDTEVVLGKFLGALGFFGVLLSPTLLYVVLLSAFGKLDLGPVFSGYLGMILVGALFVAIGLFCSSLTKSQVVAAVSCIAALFAVTIAPWLASDRVSLTGFWRNVVDQTVYPRYADFSKGVIDTGNIIFFIIATAVFLFGTVKVMEFRRWR
jgi:ABC-2 type transport system permease protein